MVKLNIDTGVEEFEINGGEAAGGGVLRFNPSDPNVYNRFFDARDRLIEMDQEINERQQALRDETASDEDKAAAFLKVLREYDIKIKSLLSEVFGPENDFDRILGGVNLAAAATNGERVVTNLLAALTPIRPAAPLPTRPQTAPSAVRQPRLRSERLGSAGSGDGGRDAVPCEHRLPGCAGYHRPPDRPE